MNSNEMSGQVDELVSEELAVSAARVVEHPMFGSTPDTRPSEEVMSELRSLRFD